MNGEQMHVEGLLSNEIEQAWSTLDQNFVGKYPEFIFDSAHFNLSLRVNFIRIPQRPSQKSQFEFNGVIYRPNDYILSLKYFLSGHICHNKVEFKMIDTLRRKGSVLHIQPESQSIAAICGFFGENPITEESIFDIKFMKSIFNKVIESTIN